MDEKTNDPSTEALVEAARAGNSHALNRLVERHFRVVYSIAYARLRNRESAEDLSQEVFLRVYLSLNKLKNPAIFGPWVSRIARNLAHDWHDKGCRASKLLAMAPLDARMEQTLADERAKGGREKMESEEQNEALRAAIFQLPVEQRELVLMRYIEGLSATEISERMGLHVTTVRRQLDKAIACLKESMESLLGIAAPSIRSRQSATVRAIAILGSTALLSASARSAMANFAGMLAEECLVSVSSSVTGASLPAKTIGLLKTIPVVGGMMPVATGGGMSMIGITKVVVAAVGIGLAGLGVYKYQAQAANPSNTVNKQKETGKMRTHVKREGDKVWIDGAAKLEYLGKESSVHGVQTAIMKTLGEDTSYEYLLGVSGLAFRMQIHKKLICPSSPHAMTGIQCAAESFQSLPWKGEIFDGQMDEVRKEAARKAIVASIDKGIPVQYGNEEDGLILGYQKGGKEWLCVNPMRDLGEKIFVQTQDNWPWGIVVYTERKTDIPDRRKMIVESLKKAIRIAHAQEDATKDYYVGFKAWDVYINTLESLDKADDKTRGESILGNAHIYTCTATYRAAAAKYLRDISKDFSSDAAGHLKKASDLYEQIGIKVLQDEKNCLTEIAPFPWMMKPGQNWDSAMRKEQLRRLKEAMTLEQQAIGEIEKALETIS